MEKGWDWGIIWPNLVTIVVTLGAFVLAYVSSVKTTSRMIEVARDTKLADLRTRWIEDTRSALADFDEPATKLIAMPATSSSAATADRHNLVGSLSRIKTYIRLKLNLSGQLHEKAMDCIEDIANLADKGSYLRMRSKNLVGCSTKFSR
jgi:hypothetical protein